MSDLKVTGPLRRVGVLKHGDHIGQEGLPGGGSKPGYTHGPGSISEIDLLTNYMRENWEEIDEAAGAGWMDREGRLYQISNYETHWLSAIDALEESGVWDEETASSSRKVGLGALDAPKELIELGFVRFRAHGITNQLVFEIGHPNRLSQSQWHQMRLETLKIGRIGWDVVIAPTSGGIGTPDLYEGEDALEFLGMTERHGDHIGQEGLPGGGSKPGYTHVEGSLEKFQERATAWLRQNLVNLEYQQLLGRELQPRNAKVWLTPQGDVLMIMPGSDLTHGETGEGAVMAAGLSDEDVNAMLPEGTDINVNAQFRAVLALQMAGYVRLQTSGPPFRSELSIEMDRNPTGAVRRNLKDILAMFPDAEVRYDLDTSQWYGWDAEIADADTGRDRRSFAAQVLRSEDEESVERHGDHVGQEGTPEGGSKPGYTHVEGSLPEGEDDRIGPLSRAGMEALLKWEDEVQVGKDIDENGALVLDDGTVIPAIARYANGVDFENEDLSMLKSEGVTFVITHTHPRDHPLSVGDVISTIWDRATEIRAVTPDAIYRMGFQLDSSWDEKADLGDFVRDRLLARVFDDRIVRRSNWIEENVPNISIDDRHDRAMREVYGEFWANTADRFPEVIAYYSREPRP